MMNFIESFVHMLNDFLWGYVMIIILIGTAIYFTIRTKFLQFRKIGEMTRLLGEGAAKGGGAREVSSFQAFCISLASRVGTGNLAGVATAIAIGGPGAVFWMWIIALLGASSAFSESTLARRVAAKRKKTYTGGRACYVRLGFGKK